MSEDVPGEQVRRAICQFLKRERRVDTIWINEPESVAAWAAAEGFVQFYTLPMVHVDLTGCEDLEAYISRLPKKRRRNARQERTRFDSAGAVIEPWEGPLGDSHPRLDELLACLRAMLPTASWPFPTMTCSPAPQRSRGRNKRSWWPSLTDAPSDS